jgi:hypothetical protein
MARHGTGLALFLRVAPYPHEGGGFYDDARFDERVTGASRSRNQGKKMDPESEAMKTREAHITGSNIGSVSVCGRY